MAEAYIYDAVRTPRGKAVSADQDKAPGGLSAIAPHNLVGQLIDGLAQRNGDEVMQGVSRLTLGCVGQVGSQGGHLALVSRLASKLPDTVAVKTLNNYCVSGLSAVGEAAMWTRAGMSGLSLAGGVESLSQVPFLADGGSYYRDKLLRQQLRWALPVMGAELIANLEGFEQSDLDGLALRSHQFAAAAWEAGHYAASVIPVHAADGSVALSRDEWLRSDLSMAGLQKLPPAFAEAGAKGADAMMLEAFPELSAIRHVHTIAHCPGLSDGAALVLCGCGEDAAALGLKPKAKITAFAETGGDPVLQFSAGFAAMEAALQQGGYTLDDMDLIEFMESFAATPLKFLRNYPVDPERVNVNGGLIAIGHALGATGASLLTTLLHELERRDKNVGLVVALAAGGIGSAMVIERV